MADYCYFFSKFLAERLFNFSNVDVEFKWPVLLSLYSSILYLTGSSTNVPYYTNIKRYVNQCEFDSFNVNLCTRFFISNQVAQGLKNGLKVKEPPTLKTLIQNILFGLWVTNFNFSILSSLKLNFSHNCFWHNLIVYNSIGNGKNNDKDGKIMVKCVHFTFTPGLSKWKLLSNSWATFNLENVNLLSNPTFTFKNGVTYKKNV